MFVYRYRYIDMDIDIYISFLKMYLLMLNNCNKWSSTVINGIGSYEEEANLKLLCHLNFLEGISSNETCINLTGSNN